MYYYTFFLCRYVLIVRMQDAVLFISGKCSGRILCDA